MPAPRPSPSCTTTGRVSSGCSDTHFIITSYSQGRFDGFVVVLDAFADGARVEEEHGQDFDGSHRRARSVRRKTRVRPYVRARPGPGPDAVAGGELSPACGARAYGPGTSRAASRHLCARSRGSGRNAERAAHGAGGSPDRYGVPEVTEPGRMTARRGRDTAAADVDGRARGPRRRQCRAELRRVRRRASKNKKSPLFPGGSGVIFLSLSVPLGAEFPTVRRPYNFYLLFSDFYPKFHFFR